MRPTHYAVAVVPHAESSSFDGKVTVDIEVLAPTSSITLNAVDLAFQSVQLTPVSGKGASAGTVAAPKVSIDDKAQTATFAFAQPLPVGSYKLAMDYTGKIFTSRLIRTVRARL